jgi:hypothetical protein
MNLHREDSVNLTLPPLDQVLAMLSSVSKPKATFRQLVAKMENWTVTAKLIERPELVQTACWFRCPVAI